jgi:hypothetical protein
VKLTIHKILVPILRIGGAIPLLPTRVSGTHRDSFYAEVTGNGENCVTRSFIIFILYHVYYVHQQKGKMDGICTKYGRDKILHNTLTI